MPQTNHIMADPLADLLAATFQLYQKTHGYHWNVRGPQFRSLHLLFKEQYEELFAAADRIAEQMRSLDFLAPQEFSDYTDIPAGDPRNAWRTMVDQLRQDNGTCVDLANKLVAVAKRAEDEGTLTLAADRINAHKKATWMLRATLEQ